MTKLRKIFSLPYVWIPLAYVAISGAWIFAAEVLTERGIEVVSDLRYEHLALDFTYVALSALVLLTIFRNDFRRYAGLEAAQEQTREELRDVFKKYQELTTLSPIALIKLDVAGSCTDVSARWRDLTGQSNEKSLGNGWQDLIHPDDRPQFDASLTKLARHGEPLHMQLRLLRQDASTIWVSATVLPQLSDSGLLLGFIGSVVDVTETKRMEQRARYHASLLEHVSDAILSTDRDWRIISWNRAAETMYGYTADEAIGKLATDLLKTEYPLGDGSDAESIIRNGAWDGELIQRSKQGESIYVLTGASVLYDEMDQPSGLVVINRDISARHHAETEVLASKTMYQTVFDNSPVGIGLAQHDGNVIAINRAMHELSGYTASEIGLDGTENSFFSDAAGGPVNVLSLVKDGKLDNAEAQIKRKDKSTIDVLVTLREVQYQGAPCWHFIIQDVTERRRMEEALRESEELYRTVFETSSIGLSIADLNGRVIRVNDAILEPGGYSREDIFDNPDVQRLYFNENDRKQILERFQRGEPIDRVPVAFRRKDGSPYDTLLTLRSVTLRGNPCVHAIVEDVTQQRRAAERLRELTGRLTTAQEEERQRVARELHDAMGQALSAAKVRLKLLANDIPPDLPLMKEQADILSGILDEALASVRSLSLELRPPLLEELGWYAALEALCEGFSKRTGLDVSFEHSGRMRRLRAPVELAVYRVVQEALTNALRHSGGSRVEVRTRFADSMLEVKIKDNGRGFDISRVSIAGERGIGLGLLSMQERTATAGGTLEITSQPRQGTSIAACFPSKGENGEANLDLAS